VGGEEGEQGGGGGGGGGGGEGGGGGGWGLGRLAGVFQFVVYSLSPCRREGGGGKEGEGGERTKINSLPFEKEKRELRLDSIRAA